MKKEYKFGKVRRSAAVSITSGKTQVTIRIDDDVLEWFRAEVDAARGGNYQTLINNALREYVTNQYSTRKPSGSPLDVDGVDLNLSRIEILESIEEGRSE